MINRRRRQAGNRHRSKAVSPLEGLRQTLSQGRERKGIYTRPDILMGCQAAIAGKPAPTG
ncbi:hypothetical protein C7A12_13290 [Pseudomonas fluorescens]|nr:hypothetical protein C7A12_13290 [Pseudomonas fluorescens]PRW78747.1 hypothetical protein C7A13_12900 [Pseudomonas fluorescens]